MKVFQDWCIELVTRILQEGDPSRLEGAGYKNILKQLITKYADVYWSASGFGRKKRQWCQVNLWWSDCNRANFDIFFAPLLFSKEAKCLVDHCSKNLNSLKYNPKTKRPDRGRCIHFEHITPKEFLFEKLLKLIPPSNTNPPSYEMVKEKVTNILQLDRIAVITKAEADLLDGAGMYFDNNDCKMLENLGINEIITNEVEEANNLVKGRKRPKDHGSAYLRMCYLKRHGVEFVYHNETLPIEKWHMYFENKEFELKQP